MVRRRQRERGPFGVLLPDADKLWPAWLKRIDTLLEDETVIDTVATALAPKVITDLHQRVVDVAQRAGVTHGHDVVESSLVIVRPVRSGPAWPNNSPRLRASCDPASPSNSPCLHASCDPSSPTTVSA